MAAPDHKTPEEYRHYAERVEHYVPIFKEEFTFYPPRREQDVKVVMPAVAVRAELEESAIALRDAFEPFYGPPLPPPPPGGAIDEPIAISEDEEEAYNPPPEDEAPAVEEVPATVAEEQVVAGRGAGGPTQQTEELELIEEAQALLRQFPLPPEPVANETRVTRRRQRSMAKEALAKEKKTSLHLCSHLHFPLLKKLQSPGPCLIIWSS